MERRAHGLTIKHGQHYLTSPGINICSEIEGVSRRGNGSHNLRFTRPTAYAQGLQIILVPFDSNDIAIALFIIIQNVLMESLELAVQRHVIARVDHVIGLLEGVIIMGNVIQVGLETIVKVSRVIHPK